MTRDQLRVTEYLLAENAMLREQLRGRRILYTDAQRRRLATAATKLGRQALRQLDTWVRPDTFMRSRQLQNVRCRSWAQYNRGASRVGMSFGLPSSLRRSTI